MQFLTRLIVSALAVIVTSLLLPGVHIAGALTAVIVAAVLAFLNAILKPILVFLTIPVTLVTFGLFLLVINALIIMLASRIVPGFKVDGFWWALIFSLLLSFINSFFESLARRRTDGR
jgi:putative membrane protein